MFRPLVAKLSIGSDRNLGSVTCPKGTNWKNGHIRPIAPIVTKRACLTDRQTDKRTDRRR
jgi:hypothetical protein